MIAPVVLVLPFMFLIKKALKAPANKPTLIPSKNPRE